MPDRSDIYRLHENCFSVWPHKITTQELAMWCIHLCNSVKKKQTKFNTSIIISLSKMKIAYFQRILLRGLQ